MITNFEEYTHELTDIEINKIVPAIVRGLKNKIGKDKIVTNKTMREGLKSVLNINTSEARIRKMIHYIRITGLVERLIATSRGYYISNDKSELQEYIDGLHKRADSISLIAKQLDFQTKNIH